MLLTLEAEKSGVNMQFTHDTATALTCTAALVNTAPHVREPEGLPTVAALDAFLDTHAMSGRRDRDAAELTAVHALRPRLRALWSGEEEDVVRVVNALLVEAPALPQLVRHDGWDYHLHATDSDAPVAVRLGVEAAMAVVDVIRARELDRLRICAADDCEDVTVDLSKNRSRMYCDVSCANRMHAAAYRARRPGR